MNRTASLKAPRVSTPSDSTRTQPCKEFDYTTPSTPRS
jgi:hypothetical protein